MLGGVRRVLDWLLPPQCLSCGALCETPGGLCAECWDEAVFLDAPWCARCGLPFELPIAEGAECGACMREPPVYDRARAAMAYDDLSRRVILGLKYGDRTDTVPALTDWLSRAGAGMIDEADFIAPVPLHWTRLLSRRFNQAAMLARLLARQHGLYFAPELLRRHKRTPTQAGLSPAKRRRNVQGVFKVDARWRKRIAGRRVLLVDDVMTTGATVNACAKVLKRHGAGAVDVLSVARVVRPRRD